MFLIIFIFSVDLYFIKRKATADTNWATKIFPSTLITDQQTLHVLFLLDEKLSGRYTPTHPSLYPSQPKQPKRKSDRQEMFDCCTINTFHVNQGRNIIILLLIQ